jgi:hypothetical protein
MVENKLLGCACIFCDGLSRFQDWRTAPSGKTASWEVFLFEEGIPELIAACGSRADLESVQTQDEMLGRFPDTVA